MHLSVPAVLGLAACAAARAMPRDVTQTSTVDASASSMADVLSKTETDFAAAATQTTTDLGAAAASKTKTETDGLPAATTAADKKGDVSSYFHVENVLPFDIHLVGNSITAGRWQVKPPTTIKANTTSEVSHLLPGDIGSAAKFEYKGSGSGDGLRVKFEVASPASGPNVAKIESSDDRAEVGVQFNENDAPLRAAFWLSSPIGVAQTNASAKPDGDYSSRFSIENKTPEDWKLTWSQHINGRWQNEPKMVRANTVSPIFWHQDTWLAGSEVKFEMMSTKTPSRSAIFHLSCPVYSPDNVATVDSSNNEVEVKTVKYNANGHPLIGAPPSPHHSMTILIYRIVAAQFQVSHAKV